MPRNPQTTTAFTVSLPVPMARQIERARKAEHRSRSELTREAFRVYFRTKADEDEGRAAAARARAGIGLSRAYDNADEFIADLHTAARRLKPKRRSR
ncbi:MAG TPA: ribbon-helix-helix protein, CopG family [Candidatus Acidoferrales bacterium]|nr:ribbon-helix-helix protein, CopG family [Candidatus Acidoferrales bacterium]